jgi:hypothetical protein
MYKEYPEIPLKQLKSVAWWLSEPIRLPKGWRKYRFSTGIILAGEEMLPMMLNAVATEN